MTCWAAVMGTMTVAPPPVDIVRVETGSATATESMKNSGSVNVIAGTTPVDVEMPKSNEGIHIEPNKADRHKSRAPSLQRQTDRQTDRPTDRAAY